ncbi:NUDIX hydrolase [Cohnella xylanilytica]|uniref:8-oxo-dGTP diphosphatase n=1 Tax=Cohnella xylanilytica TaxID=557555 RepID=A0A841U6T4_9BACL|nr:8-oxo-dGTP diphosphatase MutT [Cohnella xylanilytica]MBB6693700.1 8-oxo-dGTP diphosphatase MutT [Cohnella xylanilytica]GIO15195.1 NUDIX hydrolase [Cohnella xylanilytica]
MKRIDVAAAIVADEEGRVLIARRREGKAQAGRWEFPGGKIEPGETPEACIVRELKEEMDIDVRPGERFGEYEHDYGDVRIRLIAHLAAYEGGAIRLADHDRHEWARPADLLRYPLAPADVGFAKRLAGAADGQEE